MLLLSVPVGLCPTHPTATLVICVCPQPSFSRTPILGSQSITQTDNPGQQPYRAMPIARVWRPLECSPRRVVGISLVSPPLSYAPPRGHFHRTNWGCYEKNRQGSLLHACVYSEHIANTTCQPHLAGPTAPGMQGCRDARGLVSGKDNASLKGWVIISEPRGIPVSLEPSCLLLTSRGWDHPLL